MAKKAQASGTAHPVQKKVETKEVSLQGAFVVPSEWVNEFMVVIGELPRKLSPMIDPLIDKLSKCHRGDINLTVPVEETPEEEK